jgi:hypothetical protein
VTESPEGGPVQRVRAQAPRRGAPEESSRRRWSCDYTRITTSDGSADWSARLVDQSSHVWGACLDRALTEIHDIQRRDRLGGLIHWSWRSLIPVRVWCWPGNTSDSPLIRQVRDELRDWILGKLIWVGDRGFTPPRTAATSPRAAGATSWARRCAPAPPRLWVPRREPPPRDMHSHRIFSEVGAACSAATRGSGLRRQERPRP